MGLFDFLNQKSKSAEALQAELKALCEKMKLQSDYYYHDDLDKYEELLKQLYLRGVEPKIKLLSREKREEK